MNYLSHCYCVILVFLMFNKTFFAFLINNRNNHKIQHPLIHNNNEIRMSLLGRDKRSSSIRSRRILEPLSSIATSSSSSVSVSSLSSMNIASQCCDKIRYKFNSNNIFNINKLRNIYKNMINNNNNTNKKNEINIKINKNQILRKILLWLPLSYCLLGVGVSIASVVSTSGSAGSSSVIAKSSNKFQRAGTWLMLFSMSALLHSAETAFTKISPWKVKEIVEEEGTDSPYATLAEGSTKMLTTILLTTTSMSIYSTALFVSTMAYIFPKLSLGSITAALTVVTLLFGEILPKALAVSNPEVVVRFAIKPINYIATLLQPLTTAVLLVSNLMLSAVGLKSGEDKVVTEDMLRMMVAEAQRDPESGIETKEGRMIEGVLDLQEQPVKIIMQPRINMLALPIDCSATEILRCAVESKYSRIPIYDGDIDNIIGVVMTKDLMEYILVPGSTLKDQDVGHNNRRSNKKREKDRGGLDKNNIKNRNNNIYNNYNQNNNNNNNRNNNNNGGNGFGNTSSNSKDFSSTVQPRTNTKWVNTKALDLMVPTYFIPETMSTWTALQEMRVRNKHMAIVVDEYGGTAGLVTFEDILEEVVGEIYDEDDAEEKMDDMQTISMDSNGFYTIVGNADLDDVNDALSLNLDEELLSDHSTIAGLLVAQAGEIPILSSHVTYAGYVWTVIAVDDRRILRVTAEEARELEDGWDGNWEEYRKEREIRLLQEESERNEKDNKNKDNGSDKDIHHDSNNSNTESIINGVGSDLNDLREGEESDKVLRFSIESGEWVEAEVGAEVEYVDNVNESADSDALEESHASNGSI